MMYEWKVTNGFQVMSRGFSMKREWALEDAKEAAETLHDLVSYPVSWVVEWTIGNAKNEIYDTIK